ncbi:MULTISPECIES: HP0495 family protein [unclassified Helicobacter]|uniref:HP0495 family protein n=1 Tax=unclassified Helicobacter TaxID=2593540 RepID=UPI000CF14DB4|nr:MULTISPECIES: DUF493 domain-containing protein [unclassified Helicobacter]
MEAEIKYPCKWEYRIIGDDEDRIKGAVFEVVDKEYQLSKKNTSAKGNYVSMHLIVEVENEQMRNEIFQKLQKLPFIKMVI